MKLTTVLLSLPTATTISAAATIMAIFSLVVLWVWWVISGSYSYVRKEGDAAALWMLLSYRRLERAGREGERKNLSQQPVVGWQ